MPLQALLINFYGHKMVAVLNTIFKHFQKQTRK